MKKAKNKNISQPCSHEARPRSCNSPLIMAAFERIAQCRAGQQAAFAEGFTLFDCSSMVTDDSRKLRRLSQALGEVADSIELLEREVSPSNVENQFGALTTLASHCVAWLEALEARDLKLRQRGAMARKLPPVTQEEIDTILHGRSR